MSGAQPRRLRVAQFTSSLLAPLGGAEQYCLALARHQLAAGHDVTIVTGWCDPEIASELRAEGFAVVILTSARPYSPDRNGTSPINKVRFHAAETLDSARRTHATRALEALNVDVLHVHRWAGFGSAVLRVRGPRVVHTVHDFGLVHTSASLVSNGEVLSGPSLLQRVRARLALRGVSPDTTFVFPSARTRDRHVEWGFPDTAFDSRVIAHGWAGAVPPAVARRPFDGRPINYLFLGKVSDHKGIPLLLRAWGDGIAGTRLRIAGDGPLAALAAAAPGVEPLGWLDADARSAALGDADVLVFPSAWPENFPLVVAESMLAGVPVVTTTTASPPLVDDGESGLVVAPDAASLRLAMQRLVADPALLERLVAGTRARAEELDLVEHGHELERVYGLAGVPAPVA